MAAAAVAAAAAALTLLGAATSQKAAFNLYLERHESRRLFGLDVELYYVKEGSTNEYALGFVVPVPANVSELEMVWQGLGPAPLAYALDVQVDDAHRALGRPSLDVTPTGTLPPTPRTFRVHLPCTGEASAEVPIRIVLNVSQLHKLHRHGGGDATSVSLPRNKICTRTERAPWRVGAASATASGASIPSSSPRPLVLVAACACAAVAAVGLAAAAAWLVRARKARTSLGTSPPEDAAAWQAWPDGQLTCSPALGLWTESEMGAPTPPAVRLGSCSRAGSTAGGVLRCSSPTTSPTDLSERLEEIRVERHKVTLLEKLHQGTFGQMYHGLLVEEWAEVGAEQNVLVKTVTGEASPGQASLLVREGLSLFGMNHANVLAVVGAVCSEPGPPMLLYPYMSGGNLKRFLREADQVLITQDLVDMAIQIAEGLQYLHKRGFVHRDVGTRNCAVDDRLHVKLADSALSRDLFPDDYHCLGDGENRPVKWLALESLLLGEFSTASDLWMYGVALWELMTLGQQPYIELDPFEVAAHLSRGYRLGQPVNCPDPLFRVMEMCWRTQPEDRPGLATLLRLLADLYAALCRFI